MVWGNYLGVLFFSIGLASAQVPNYELPRHFPISYAGINGAVVGRFNLDSVDDLLIPLMTGSSSSSGFQNRILLFQSDGSLFNFEPSFQTVRNDLIRVAAPPQIRAGVGDLNGDQLDDLVFLHADGTLRIQLNINAQAAYERKQVAFAPARTVEVMGHSLNYTLPITNSAGLLCPMISLVDVNRDGHLDIVIASTVANLGSGTSNSNPLFVYLGDGSGGVQLPPLAIVLPPHRTPLDLEWKDDDGDGSMDRLFIAEEEASFIGWTIFDNYVEQFRITSSLGGTPTFQYPSGSPHVGNQIAAVAGRVQAFEVKNVVGDDAEDFVFAVQRSQSLNSLQSTLEIYQGDASGYFENGTLTTLTIPNSGAAAEMPSVQVEDFNGDGINDVEALIGNTGTQNGQVLVSFGTRLGSGPGAIYGLGAPVLTDLGAPYKRWITGLGFSTFTSYFYGPGRTSPDQLVLLDLNADGRREILVPDTRPAMSGVTTPVGATLLKNLMGDPLSDPLLQEVGTGSPLSEGPMEISALGTAKPGSTLTINWLNAPDNTIAGLNYGEVPLDFQIMGIWMHMVPSVFSNLYYTGSSPGGLHLLQQSIAIPNDPSFVGMSGRFQWVGIEPPGTLGSSKALEFRVGN